MTPRTTAAPAAPPAIAGSHLAKSFGNVHALVDASVSVQPGEVVAIVGDNGAGKSQGPATRGPRRLRTAGS